MSRRVVLIGGGHAHVEFIRRFGLAPIDDVELVVFDASRHPVYSGMVPGVVAGMYEKHEVEIDLAALCAKAGARFVEEAVVRVDAHARAVEGSEGSTATYDVASLDIGSTVAGLDAPGVREFALASRPIRRLIDEIDGWIARLSERGIGADDGAGVPSPLHIVGGGAAGIELAFCLDARLEASLPAPLARSRVEVVTADDTPLTGGHPRVRRRVARALAKRGIRVRTGTLVAALHEGAIEFEDGERFASSGALWVTGPAAHSLPQDSGLPCDDRGFVRIGSTLQVTGHPDLFAVGDCASLAGLPKAGVYAVRAAPVLDSNLRARLQGSTLDDYSPQTDFLSLLNLGNGTAIGSKWGIAYQGRAALWLKDRIDRAFMERYR